MKCNAMKVLLLIVAAHLCDANKSRSIITSSTIERGLSQQLFLNYEPKTDVIDQSRIDLDLKKIEEEISKKTETGLQNALNIYQNGAYSKIYAIFTLTEDEGLPITLDEGTHINGLTVLGKPQSGKLYGTAIKGATTIKVLYATSKDCSIHGLASEMNGCFSETGNITLGYSKIQTKVNYSYNIREDTKSDRTLQRFSTDSESQMWSCKNCPYDDYQKFVNYYGESDYANQWIIAAFKSAKTNLLIGNIDFSIYDEECRDEMIKKSISYMNIWMYVIHEMESAIDECNYCITNDVCDKADQAIAWDAAAAFYVGSLEDGSGSGYMPFVLANQICQHFDTCSSFSTEEAIVNIGIIDQFLRGQQKLAIGKCEDARKAKERIVQLMTVPLVQGTLRYAHIMGVQNDTREKTRAEVLVFAASILPMVHDCSVVDAETISNNLNAEQPVFQEVKRAFENNYECLGITCEDIGGLLDRSARGKQDQQYFKGAQPCSFIIYDDVENTHNPDDDTKEDGIMFQFDPHVTLIALVVIIIILSISLFCVSWKSKKIITDESGDDNKTVIDEFSSPSVYMTICKRIDR